MSRRAKQVVRLELDSLGQTWLRGMGSGVYVRRLLRHDDTELLPEVEMVAQTVDGLTPKIPLRMGEGMDGKSWHFLFIDNPSTRPVTLELVVTFAPAADDAARFFVTEPATISAVDEDWQALPPVPPRDNGYAILMRNLIPCECQPCDARWGDNSAWVNDSTQSYHGRDLWPMNQWLVLDNLIDPDGIWTHQPEDGPAGVVDFYWQQQCTEENHYVRQQMTALVIATSTTFDCRIRWKGEDAPGDTIQTWYAMRAFGEPSPGVAGETIKRQNDMTVCGLNSESNTYVGTYATHKGGVVYIHRYN